MPVTPNNQPVAFLLGSDSDLPTLKGAFETLDQPLRIDEVVFSTVGQDRIKCLRPRPLFALPLLRIASCRDAVAIEARLRLAWHQHLNDLCASQLGEAG